MQNNIYVYKINDVYNIKQENTIEMRTCDGTCPVTFDSDDE